MTPTHEMLVLAERIAGSRFGSCSSFEAALAAIIETSEKAAELVEGNQQSFSDEGARLSRRFEGNRDGLAYATAIRNGEHLK